MTTGHGSTRQGRTSLRPRRPCGSVGCSGGLRVRPQRRRRERRDAPRHGRRRAQGGGLRGARHPRSQGRQESTASSRSGAGSVGDSLGALGRTRRRWRRRRSQREGRPRLGRGRRRLPWRRRWARFCLLLGARVDTPASAQRGCRQGRRRSPLRGRVCLERRPRRGHGASRWGRRGRSWRGRDRAPPRWRNRRRPWRRYRRGTRRRHRRSPRWRHRRRALRGRRQPAETFGGRMRRSRSPARRWVLRLIEIFELDLRRRRQDRRSRLAHRALARVGSHGLRGAWRALRNPTRCARRPRRDRDLVPALELDAERRLHRAAVSRLGVGERDAVEQMIEFSCPESDEHRLVLLLHERAHLARHLLVPEVLAVRGLGRTHDPATVGEEVRDDVRMLHAGVFRLDMEDPPSVPDVVVEAEERRVCFHGGGPRSDRDR